MRIQPPIPSLCRSLVTNTIRLKVRPVRMLVLLASLTMAATALAAVASPAGAFRQLIFGAKASATRSSFTETKAALVDPLLAVTPQSGSSTMTVARHGHTASRLSDGRVLIVGGENADGFVTAAEIFDPAAGTFSPSGNLNTSRADHTATLLSDGRVLIAGGRSSSGSLNSTEIFDPASGAFANGPNLNSARAGQSATVLSDGRTLFAGGDSIGSAEIYDLQSGSSYSISASMNDARSAYSAALLQDGRVLIVGGRDAGGNGLSSGEIFDPATSSFIGVGGMEDARVRPLLRVLFDGKVQIIGGNDHRSLEIYDPAAGIFGGHAHLPPDGDLHPELINEIMVSPSRAALLTGGQTIMELAGSNQALAAGGVDATGSATSAATTYASSLASVSSDKVDYLPGTPVLITGRGFQPNEIVDLTFHEDPHVDTAELHSFTVQADADGNFNFDQYSPEAADVGITYILGAKGETSGWTAQTTFHDSVSVTAGSGGTSISADKAANATLPQYTTLGDIVIGEGANGDFASQTSTTLTLTAPTGWQFNAGVGTTSTTKSGPGSNELTVNRQLHGSREGLQTGQHDSSEVCDQFMEWLDLRQCGDHRHPHPAGDQIQQLS